MRKILIAAGVVSIVSMAMAQKLEVGADVGYGFGMGVDSLGSNSQYNSNGDVVKWEDVYASRGNGVKIMGECTYYLNENLGIMAMGGYSMRGGYSTEASGVDMYGAAYSLKTTRKTSYVPLNIGLKFRTKIIGNIMPYVYVAPGLFLPKQEDTRPQLAQPGSSAPPDEVLTYTFATGFCFTAGLGAALNVFNNLGVKLEIAPTFAFANLTKTVDKLTDRFSTTTTTTTNFKNTTTTLPADSTYYDGTNNVFNIKYCHGQPRCSFNSAAVRLGVYYSF